MPVKDSIKRKENARKAQEYRTLTSYTIAKNDKERCMYKGCKFTGYIRGICEMHRGICQRAIWKGLITWKELEEMGYAKASKTPWKK